MTKAELQQQAVELMKHNDLLVLQWCTSLGKSKAAIEIMKSMADPSNKKSVLLVVAEIAHKSNWRDEFTKWNLNLLEFDITIETYASLKHHRNKKYDLLILDEAHHIGSDLRMEILEEIKANKVLALSATLALEILLKLRLLYGVGRKMRFSTVNLQKAIDWGILPKPRVYLIPMELDNTVNDQEIIETRGKSPKKKVVECTLQERWKYLKDKEKYPNITLRIPCTALQKYLHISAEAEFWKKKYFYNRVEAIKNKWLQLGSKRKRYLGNLKTVEAQNLLERLKDKRYLCFCSSIEQVEALGGNNAIHSGKKDSLATINNFNNKEIDSLFAVGMIQEGQNLVDIDAVVIVQLDGQERSFVQKVGRGMRAEDPIIVIMYYKETRDEEYLQGALEGIDPDYVIEVSNLDEIKI